MKKRESNGFLINFLSGIDVSGRTILGISFNVAGKKYWQVYPILEVILPQIKSYSPMNRTFHMKDTKFKLGDAIT
ncbi:hypothetical protein [Bacillus sp. FJAT-27445]|uniref:hypothetical protein n=1 Tax=Bacillus sp. FJAT-27445 TaxID=1679166 RepID=UPI00074420E1|nr:hypothetical protein [Bacillus sp. FJAT-27445]